MHLLRSLVATAALAPVAAAWAQAPYADMFGAWSPDGAHIVFTSDRTGDPEIYIANTDGTCARQLTTTPGRDAHPAFSPDGGTIVFQSPRHEGDTRIFTMNLDGSNQRELMKTTGFCGVPYYSPDGAKIALMCSSAKTQPGSEAAPWRILVANADGTDLTQVTHGPGNDQVANWAPDGGSFIFFSNRSGSDQLHRMTIDTGELVQLTSAPGRNRVGAYAPDGQSIAFMSDRENGRWDVYVASPDGSKARRITDFGNEYGGPVFSPDGRRLMVSLRPPAGPRLGVIDSDGANFQQLDFRDCARRE